MIWWGSGAAGEEGWFWLMPWKRMTAHFTTSSASFVDCSEITFPVVAGVPTAFEISGAFATAATTTGISVAINGPTLATDGLVARVERETTAVAGADAVNTQVINAYDTLTNTTSIDAANAYRPFRIHGVIETTVSGSVVLRVRSEVAASNVTIHKNTRVSYLPMAGVSG